MTIQNATIENFIELIETNFEEYSGKISRVDVKWGMWSRIMNKEIRRRIDEKDPDSIRLSMVFNYWITMSQLLELKFKYKGKLFGRNKIKKKIREAQLMKEALNNANPKRAT